MPGRTPVGRCFSRIQRRGSGIHPHASGRHPLSHAARTLLLAVVLALAVAGQAAAATPFTAGEGSTPSVAVGSDGTGHVVWATPNPTKVGYCRISPGAGACNRTELLAYGSATHAR